LVATVLLERALPSPYLFEPGPAPTTDIVDQLLEAAAVILKGDR
jgi:hypothetical protein